MASLNQFDDVGLDSFALEVSSDARKSGTANHPIYFFNNDMINVCGICVVDALVPFSYNTVIERYNNQVRVIVPGDSGNGITACTFMLVFKNGNYNAANVTAYIQNEIDNLGAVNALAPGGSYVMTGAPTSIQTSSRPPAKWVVVADPSSRKLIWSCYRNLAAATYKQAPAPSSQPAYTGTDDALKGVPFSLDFTVPYPIHDVFGFKQLKVYNPTTAQMPATKLPYAVRTSDVTNNPNNCGTYMVADETPNFVGAPKLVLRSNLTSLYGSYISPNPGGGYSSGVASIIVPVNPNKTIVYENMHAFFSKFPDTRLDQLELWWTYGNTNIEVDFNGVDWSVQFRMLRRSETGTNINRNAMGDRTQRVVWTGAK